jgi:predicted DNA-binding transcriptional regulator YafY
MASGSNDTLVQRLAMMLVKLNQGESLDPRALAQEFGVNVRTIQRDINERFGYLPLEKIDGAYRMTPAFLGRLTLKDIDRFAALAGVAGLFPSLSVEFLRDIFDARVARSGPSRTSSGPSWRAAACGSPTPVTAAPRLTKSTPTSSSTSRGSGTWQRGMTGGSRPSRSPSWTCRR